MDFNSTVSSSFRGTSSQSSEISSELSGKILMTHASTTREVDLKPLVKVIDGIFQNAVSKGAYVVSTDMISSLDMRQVEDIRGISCEMSCNQTGVEATTMAVLKRLSTYSWNAKMVLAIAAFAVSVGDLLMQVNYRNTDTNAMCLDIIKGPAPKIDLSILSNLVRAMQEVLQNNMTFLVPPISTIPKYSASMKEAIEYFPTATYKILRIIVQIASIFSKKEENIELRIRRLIIEVYTINDLLGERIEVIRKEIESPYTPSPPKPDTFIYPQSQERTNIITYETLWELIPTISYWELIQSIKYSLKIQVPDKLRNKHLLFLVSGLDLSVEEIKLLKHFYLKRNMRYEIVWLPMVDLTNYDSRKLSELQSLMEWISVDPSKMGTVMMEYIKKEWHFLKNPIGVALNPDGSVACPNALPMLWIWGNAAFPFTGLKEKELWSTYDERNGWKLDLLIDEHIDLEIPSWIRSTDFVCLFGGEDKSWIQEFIQNVERAITGTGITLRPVYVGTNKGKGLPRNQLQLKSRVNIHVIESEFQWHFWTRLESILYTKIQQGKTTKTDLVMKEASRILGYASKGEAWAMFAMGTAVMVTASRQMATKIMGQYSAWKKDATSVGTGFVEAIRSYYSTIKAEDVHVGGCINFHLPVMLGEVPGNVSCPDCSKEMKVFYTYRCCNE